MFAEVTRVLRPGGVLVAVDSLASEDLREFHHDDIYMPIDPDGLTHRLTAAGLVDVTVSVNADHWHATARKPPPT